jgi:D-erythro-7,8-dihydroneopterin triphosphate epimerase
MSFNGDQIHIRDLLLRGILGINQSEREKKQDILISMTIDVPRFPKGAPDDISSSINYRDICKRTIALVEGSSFQLIETLATYILQHLFDEFDLVRVSITIDKPHALRFAESVGFSMTRVVEDFV